MTPRTLAAAMAAGMTPADLARLQQQLARLREIDPPLVGGAGVIATLARVQRAREDQP